MTSKTDTPFTQGLPQNGKRVESNTSDEMTGLAKRSISIMTAFACTLILGAALIESFLEEFIGETSYGF